MVPPRFLHKDFWQQLLGVAVVVSVIAVLISSAQAAPIISDSNMSSGDWTSQVLLDTTPGGDATVNTSSAIAGGNPGTYLEIEHTYTGPGDMTAGHITFLGFHVPFADGALNALTYSFDVNFLNTPGVGGSPPGAVAFRAMLFQGSAAYQAGFQIATTAAWTTLTFANLIASDFSLFNGAGPLLPDFSEFGDPILFGFLTGNGSAFGGQNTTVFGVDNFTVSNVVAELPGPASVFLLSIGLGVMAARRRT